MRAWADMQRRLIQVGGTKLAAAGEVDQHGGGSSVAMVMEASTASSSASNPRVSLGDFHNFHSAVDELNNAIDDDVTISVSEERR